VVCCSNSVQVSLTPNLVTHTTAFFLSYHPMPLTVPVMPWLILHLHSLTLWILLSDPLSLTILLGVYIDSLLLDLRDLVSPTSLSSPVHFVLFNSTLLLTRTYLGMVLTYHYLPCKIYQIGYFDDFTESTPLPLL